MPTDPTSPIYYAVKRTVKLKDFTELASDLPTTNRLWKALLEGVEKAAATSASVPRSTQIRRLIQAYNDERLVLVFGAGVSAPYGLPTWNTLLQKLLLSTISKEIEQSQDKARVLAQLYTALLSPNPLIAARYLSNHYRKNDGDSFAFERAIRDALYEEIKADEESETYKETRQLCVAPGKSPSLDSIITYNYDDLLERCLRSIDVEIPFSSVYAVGMNPDPGELPIYHVHGFLPRDQDLTDAHRVALSDDRYHQQYTDVYSWDNMVQINKFKDFTCLFVGTSLTDPNLRRLLDIARTQRGDDGIRHYVIRRHYDAVELADRLRRLLAADTGILDEKKLANLQLEETVEHLRKIAERFEEDDARSFGVSTIWVNEHDEIPGILRQIRRRRVERNRA